MRRIWPMKIFLWAIRLMLLSLGLFSFAIVLYIGGSLALILLKIRGLWKYPDLFYSTLTKTLRLMTALLYKIELSGEENIPETGRAIIAARHREIWDIPFMAIAALERRKVKFIAREDMRWMDFLKPAREFVIQIDREKITPSQVKAIIKSLREEELVGIFPEGTRSPSERDYYAGLIKFAEKTKSPIIPLNIDARSYGEKGWLSRLWSGRVKVDLKIGEPVEVEEIKSRFKRDRNYQQVKEEDYPQVTKYFLEEIVDKI